MPFKKYWKRRIDHPNNSDWTRLVIGGGGGTFYFLLGATRCTITTEY